MRQVSTRTLGLVGGGLFFAHAMIPNSYAWPLLWPALAGAIAAYQVAPRARGFFAAIGTAARVGLIAGVLFLIATAAALAALGMPGFASVSSLLGATSPITLSGAVLASLAVAALIGLAAAVLAGAAAYPFSRRAA